MRHFGSIRSCLGGLKEICADPFRDVCRACLFGADGVANAVRIDVAANWATNEYRIKKYVSNERSY
jgi:hypothetical protein